jgi:hypothetical protein
VKWILARRLVSGTARAAAVISTTDGAEEVTEARDRSST